jgi:hypothetical protein
VSLAIPVPVSPAATTAAAALPSAPAATTPTLFGPIAAFAVNRTVPAGLKWHRGGLSTTGADHGCSRAHARAGAPTRAITALVLGMGGSVPASGGALLRLPARFAAPGRGVAAFLEKLLFTGGENKFLTAVATGK